MSSALSTSAVSSAPTTAEDQPLLGQSLEQLTDWVKAHGQPAYRGKQLHQWIYDKGVRSLGDITVFSKAWRAEIAAVPVGRAQLHLRSQAPDGTVKYLLRLQDGHIIEAVGIPTAKRLTVCVSSQVVAPWPVTSVQPAKGAFYAT
ncbi:MAG: hypothetical protein ACFB0C_08790 [Leptolyngbyaceae cyanobacterium]